MKQYSTGDAQGTQDSVAEGEKTQVNFVACSLQIGDILRSVHLRLSLLAVDSACFLLLALQPSSRHALHTTTNDSYEQLVGLFGCALVAISWSPALCCLARSL